MDLISLLQLYHKLAVKGTIVSPDVVTKRAHICLCRWISIWSADPEKFGELRKSCEHTENLCDLVLRGCKDWIFFMFRSLQQSLLTLRKFSLVLIRPAQTNSHMGWEAAVRRGQQNCPLLPFLAAELL